MDPKDFKFNDDAFDDVMSSSEDDKNDIKSNSFEDEFEDIFSGDDNAENGHHRDFTDEYFEIGRASCRERVSSPV